MNEPDFQTAIIELAQWAGWKVHHCRPVGTRSGYRTPIQGDPGFPDLVLARRGVVIMAEVKGPRGRLDGSQKSWKHEAGSEVWRPADWDGIVARLTGKEPTDPNQIELFPHEGGEVVAPI